jgi:hypothetical protein
MKRFVIGMVAAGAALLSGCAANYTFEGKKYSSAEQFYVAVNDFNEANLREVTPLPAPVSKKRLVFALPSTDVMVSQSFAVFEKQEGKAPWGLAPEILTTITTGNRRMIRAFGEAVQKRNIYQGVRFVDLDTTTPGTMTASASEDVLYYYESDPRSQAWYYVSQSGGKQLFSYDRTPPTPSAKINAFLEAIQLQAIKE